MWALIPALTLHLSFMFAHLPSRCGQQVGSSSFGQLALRLLADEDDLRPNARNQLCLEIHRRSFPCSLVEGINSTLSLAGDDDLGPNS